MQAAIRVIIITQSQRILVSLSFRGICVRWQPEWTLSQKVMRFSQVRGCSEFPPKFLDSSSACIYVCCFRHSTLLTFEFFIMNFHYPALRDPLAPLDTATNQYCHFFPCMQSKKAPSVIVFVWELRGTHILTLTQWYYSWDRVVEQCGKLQPKHNSCSLAGLTFASLGHRNSRGRRRCD